MSGDRLAGPGRSFEPDPLRQLVQDFVALRQRVDDMGAQILRSAGLRAEPDLLRVLGSLVVEGELDVTGDMVVGGTLSLPNGIIDNAALANPIAFAGNRASVSTVVPPTSPTFGTAVSMSLTVPSWATTAVVLAVASIGASAGSPGGAVVGYVTIDGSGGDSDVVNVATGTQGHMTLLAQRTYAPPTSIPVAVQWSAQNNIIGASARMIAIAIVGR